MFVQVIRGRVADREAFERQADKWMTELRPGAIGWVGSTGGLTDDDEFILVARFASEEAARANSDRPEQGAWWAETAPCFAGGPTFAESTDVQEHLGGGSDDAGFVQVMEVTTTRRAELEALEDKVEPLLREVHTALLGGLRVWTAPDRAIEVNYFRDEAGARAGEAAMGAHPDFSALAEQWNSLFDSVSFLDLRSPILESA